MPDVKFPRSNQYLQPLRNLFVRDQEAVGSIASAVDDAHNVFAVVVEEKEIVAKKLHLLDGLFDVHRLETKALGAHELSQPLFVIEAVDLSRFELCCLEVRDLGADGGLAGGAAAGSFAMDATDLPLQFVKDLIDGLHVIGSTFFGPQHITAGADGELGDGGVGADPVVNTSQLELGLDEMVDEVIELGCAAVDERRELIVDGNAMTANLNVHRCPPC